jgi:NAD(P)-dependent dehydrogenase (short-subunit alcohol dehydrogenase family)
MLPDAGALTMPSSSSQQQHTFRQFQDKVVVVTGGASGIGKALATAFAQNGARVALVDLRGSLEAANELKVASDTNNTISTPPLAFACDVTDANQVRKMIQHVKHKWGRIDIYCSNAGIIYPPTLTSGAATTNGTNAVVSSSDHVAKYSDQQWTKILQVNVQSHVVAARELLSDWEEGKGEGVFVVTASAAGLLTQIGDASYGVSKAAAVSFAEHLAISHPTIQVHCLCPQAVDTPFVDIIGNSGQNNSAMADGMVSPEYVAKCTLQAIRQSTFWIFPHPRVPEYYRRKVTDHARWLKGMKRLRNRLQATSNTPTKSPSSKL